MSIVATSSFYKKTFGSKSDAIVLKNGAHLIKDLESLPYTYTQKMPPA